MLKPILLGLCSFALFFVLHVLYFRRFRPTARFFVMARIYACIGLLLPAVYLLTPAHLWLLPRDLEPAGWAVGILNALLLYTFLFMAYSMFYFLVDRGFSGRIMIEIERSPSRWLTRDEIPKLYSLEMVLARRLGEMVDIGRVVKVEERYCNTPRGSRAARVFEFVKKFLRLGPGG